MPANASCSSDRVIASSAPNGSSSSSTDGSPASARAIATRCRCPPESSRGQRSAKRAGSSPTSSSARVAFALGVGHVVQPQHELDVALHAPVRQQAAILRHVADPPSQLHRINRRDVDVVRANGAVIRIDEPIEAAKERALARSTLPDERDARARGHVERHTVERDDVAKSLRHACVR